jgi:adenine-specific DNA-methyltransferase
MIIVYIVSNIYREKRKNKGTIYEQYYKGEQMRLFTWFRDVANKNDGKFIKREIKGTYWDGYNLNNLQRRKC